MSMKMTVKSIALFAALQAAGADGGRWDAAADGGADRTGARDATAAVQRCLDAAAKAGGGTVYLPPGRYSIGTLSLGANVRLELAGGARDAREGYTDAVRAATLDPSASAIVRTNGRSRSNIFLFNLVPPAYCTNGADGVSVSGGVFDCQGRMKVLAFACARGVRLENMVVKDIPNNHAFQIDGCENVAVTNCVFAGYDLGAGVLTRETIQVEQTSPGAIVGWERRYLSPILCEPEDAFINRNVAVAGCWFGPSENLGPQLIAVGHHGRVPACAGFSFTGNVVVDPLYAALRLPDFTDVTISGNTFIATNAPPALADDAAFVCLFGDRPRGPGSPVVRFSGNRCIVGKGVARRKVHVSAPRRDDMLVERHAP